jgi:hypothetical protein
MLVGAFYGSFEAKVSTCICVILSVNLKKIAVPRNFALAMYTWFKTRAVCLKSRPSQLVILNTYFHGQSAAFFLSIWHLAGGMAP